MSLNQVKNFEISSFCMESFPCQHKCEVTLNDGRKKTTHLNGVEIFAFIQALPMSKVAFEGNEDFSTYSSIRQTFPNYPQPIPATILSKIFNN